MFHPTPEWAEFLEQWHDFFLLAGTAAVTLVGLLFVALSFNLDVLIHDTKAHLLHHARSTMLSYTYVLFLSLFALVPQQSMRMLSVNTFILSTISLALHLYGAWRARRQMTSTEETFMTRRGRLLVVGYVAGIGMSVALLVTREPSLFYYVIGVMCLMIGNAAGSSWDLLVRVGKIKSANAERAAAATVAAGD